MRSKFIIHPFFLTAFCASLFSDIEKYVKMTLTLSQVFILNT